MEKTDQQKNMLEFKSKIHISCQQPSKRDSTAKSLLGCSWIKSYPFLVWWFSFCFKSWAFTWFRLNSIFPPCYQNQLTLPCCQLLLRPQTLDNPSLPVSSCGSSWRWSSHCSPPSSSRRQRPCPPRSPQNWSCSAGLEASLLPEEH